MSRLIKSNIKILLGNLIYALGIVLFIIPGGLITGGTTGIGLALKNAFGLDVSIVIGVFNILMFILGYIFFGKKFALGTTVSTVSYPIFLFILEKIIGDFELTNDILICTIFGGLLLGISIALIIRTGGSTGGIDIPLLILQNKTGLPLSKSLYVVDSIILLLQSFFTSRIGVLYGILLVIIYTYTIDKFLSSGEIKNELEIVSEKHQEIKEKIMSDLDRGVTIYHGETGKLGKKINILIVVVSPREVFFAEKLILDIDPEAFIINHRITHVHGRGFSKEKIYISDAFDEVI